MNAAERMNARRHWRSVVKYFRAGDSVAVLAAHYCVEASVIEDILRQHLFAVKP